MVDTTRVVLSSKRLAEIEDVFEDKLLNAMFDLFQSTTGDNKVSKEEFLQNLYDEDYMNFVKESCYNYFQALGYEVVSDGTDF